MCLRLPRRYVIQAGGYGRDYLLLIGSGIDGRSGALLLYRSQHLTSGKWPCDSLLFYCCDWSRAMKGYVA